MRYFKKMSPHRKFLGSDGNYFSFDIYGTGADLVGLLALDPALPEEALKIADLETADRNGHVAAVSEITQDTHDTLKKKAGNSMLRQSSLAGFPNRQQPQGIMPPLRVFRQQNPAAPAAAAKEGARPEQLAQIAESIAADPTAPPAPPTRKVSPRRGKTPVATPT